MKTVKRRVFSIKEKIEIISRLERGEKNVELAKEYNVSHSTISSIWGRRDWIQKAFGENCVKNKKMRKSTNEDIDKALLEWFKIQRAKGIPLNGPLLKAKAEDFAVRFKKENYTCSESWIRRFRERHNISFGKISGESRNVNKEICSDWINSVWPKLREGFTDEQIFNADETALFYKLTPDKTMRFRGEKCLGGKLSKERITILVTCNMTGNVKKKLLVIGKSKKPRVFKNIKNLPVIYKGNKKAWMTADIFKEYLWEWDKELRNNNKKILLLVDNCPSHPRIEHLSSIKLVFLPPNTSSLLQPMDQGVINSLKINYRKSLVLKMMQSEENFSSSSISLLEGIKLISKSWEDVSVRTIKNCFKHAGLCLNPEMQSGNLNQLFDEEDCIPLSEWINLFHVRNIEEWQEYVAVDSEAITSTEISEEDIVRDIEQQDEEDQNDMESDSSDTSYNPPTLVEAINAASLLSSFVAFNKDCTHLKDKITSIEKDLQNKYVRELSKRQTKITEFIRYEK